MNLRSGFNQYKLDQFCLYIIKILGTEIYALYIDYIMELGYKTTTMYTLDNLKKSYETIPTKPIN